MNAEAKRDQARGHALADLFSLRARLEEEGEDELLSKIAICQEPVSLACTVCLDELEVKAWCKRKWCPCCMRRLAAQRSAELQFIVERMRFPLFVTLTMKNVEDLSGGAVRTLRRAFGKLRHRQFWKNRVKGGIASIEITNIGNGWHPHLHAVIDCSWLAIKTPPPRKGNTLEENQALYKRAAQELEGHWAKCLKQPTASVKVKRASRLSIAKEVLKYSVTTEALIDTAEPIGPMIRALESCRLMTTFGKAHGQTVSWIRQAARAAARAKAKEEMQDEEPRCGCGCEEFMPLEIAKMMNRPRDRR